MASAARSASKATAAVAAKSSTKSSAKSSAKPNPKPAAKPAKAAPGNGKSAPTKAVKPVNAKADAKASKQEPVKAAKATAPAKAKEVAAKPDASAKAAKPKKQKLVRDSFTMPESEYALLGEVKKACLANGYAVKKSELLRVGVALIRTLDNASLKNWIESLPPLKPGRPRKEKQGA